MSEEIGTDGYGFSEGDGFNINSECNGYIAGMGDASGSGHGFCFDGDYKELNSPRLIMDSFGRGKSGHEHLNVSYESIE
jgi:hypothetical protein